jgi:predicted MPP superfamily phosphohydrolase
MTRKRARAGALLGGIAGAGLGWGWFEAGWVRLRTLDVPIAALPPDLDRLRIAHLADFHLGLPSRGRHAVERAVGWTVARRPDLVCISGDLVSHPRGESALRRLLAQLDVPTFAVLGNHDVEHSRDPFSRSAGLTDLAPAQLLVDEAATIELRGRRVQIVGVDPRTYRRRRAEPWLRADPEADLRILLPKGAFHLVLAGHLHDGQITIPYGFGKVRLAHLDWRYTDGIYVKPAATMHVSPGLGTSFVPFRFFARPEATELVLHPVP